jgi:alkanesulfonate monooxygenase SsuD/methylene tetrahydromethanopterin reductase-like flavin-dependent oxidoreductase (luciferase family)
MPEFGVIYEAGMLPPYEVNEPIVFGALVEQVRTAERVGFKSVWHVEHHFLEGMAHSSNSDVLLGAYAAATSTIRLGYGVKLLPYAYNHPLRAAEAVATLDQLSGGRVEFGTGRSFTREEMEGFAIDPNTTRQQWDESLHMILAAFRDEKFSWDSDSWKLPPRSVVPKPFQKPHPPLWVAGTSPDSHTLAGSLGMGLLSFSIRTPLNVLQERLEMYREAVRNCTDPIGDYINNRAATFTLVYCGETDEEARETAGKAVVDYIAQSGRYLADTVAWVAGQNAPSYAYMKDRYGMAEGGDGLTFEELDSQDMVIVGGPETCCKKVQRYVELGMEPQDILLGHFQAPGLPMDKVGASIERFGKEVIPAFL